MRKKFVFEYGFGAYCIIKAMNLDEELPTVDFSALASSALSCFYECDRYQDFENKRIHSKMGFEVFRDFMEELSPLHEEDYYDAYNNERVIKKLEDYVVNLVDYLITDIHMQFKLLKIYDYTSLRLHCTRLIYPEPQLLIFEEHQ